MKRKIDHAVLEYSMTTLSVAKQISPEAMLYWARNEEKLTKLLDIQNVEPFSPINKTPYLLPGLVETTQDKLRRKGLVKPSFIDTFNKNVPLEHPATPAINVYATQLNFNLYIDELLEEVEGIETLKQFAFTYSQIASLAQRHSGKDGNMIAVLDYKQSNMLPMVTATGELTIAVLNSRQPNGYHMKWELWFKGIDSPKFYHGVLLTKEDLPKTILHS